MIQLKEEINLSIQSARQRGIELYPIPKELAPNQTYDSPITGSIYGILLNESTSFEQQVETFHSKPYDAPPEAPILYIKPENTKAGHLETVYLPKSEQYVHVGGTLGVIIGKTANSVSGEHALKYVSGYTIVNDLSLPHDSFFRPAVKYRALDRFNPAGPWVVSKQAIPNPNTVTIVTKINDIVVDEWHTSSLIRSVETLIQDVTAFMTLSKGDCLLVGTKINLPQASVDDTVSIMIEEIGTLTTTIARETEEA